MRAFVQKLCEEFAANGNFSGVCLFKRGAETVFQGAYGFANRAFCVPNAADTRFDTASVTKIFTAAAVLQLAEQGRLRLSDRITALVDLSGAKIPEDVTVGQLLNHTSGIADDADEEAGESYAALFTDSPNYAIRECRDFLKNFAWKEPVFPAGTAARYCNCSYVLLGMAVEAVSGENYRDYFARHIFEPAGMSRTAFLSMEEINADTAEGYESVWDEAGRFAGYRKNIYAFPPRGTPDGGAYTTAGDLCRFFEAVREGRILGRDTAESFLRPHCLFTSPEPRLGVPGLYAQNGYGLEFLMLPGEETPFCIGKDGQNPGVSAYVTYYPQSDSTLVLLANQDCNVWEMTREVQREMLRQTGLIPGFDR